LSEGVVCSFGIETGSHNASAYFAKERVVFLVPALLLLYVIDDLPRTIFRQATPHHYT
jgi:hypothetical protein